MLDGPGRRGKFVCAAGQAAVFAGRQSGVVETEGRRQRPRGDVVECRILEGVDRLENTPDQRVLRLRGRHDHRVAAIESNAVFFDIARQRVRVDAMGPQQVAESFQPDRVAACREHPRAGRAFFRRRQCVRVERLLVTKVIEALTGGRSDARDAGHQVFANVFAKRPQAVLRFEFTTERRGGLIQDADTAVDERECRALADIVIVETLAVEIQAAFAVEDRLGIRRGLGHQLLRRVGHQRIRARIHAGVEVVSL